VGEKGFPFGLKRRGCAYQALFSELCVDSLKHNVRPAGGSNLSMVKGFTVKGTAGVEVLSSFHQRFNCLDLLFEFFVKSTLPQRSLDKGTGAFELHFFFGHDLVYLVIDPLFNRFHVYRLLRS